MSANMIAARIKAIRDAKKITQKQVADALGFNDRQTVSSIEEGKRKLKAVELLALSRFFDMPMSYFTDPFVLAERASFSWRKSSSAEQPDLDAFEQRAVRWIGIYHGLAEALGRLPATVPAIGITEKSSSDDVETIAERLSRNLFGDEIPGARLIDVIEENLSTIVIMVDAGKSVSGAACRIVGLNFILVNKNEIVGRRNFDLAHELFHVLTWNELPPEPVDVDGAKTKIERFADRFASSFLLPKWLLDKHRPKDAVDSVWLNEKATEFGVSAVALGYRVLNLGWITKANHNAIDKTQLINNGGMYQSPEKPQLFGKTFMSVISEGLRDGEISVRKVAESLELTVDDLGKIMDAYGVNRNFEL